MDVPVEVLPALSVALTVITLSPLERVMPEMLQLVVAVPEPPLLLLHSTLLIPLPVSEAVPLKAMVELFEVEPEAGLKIVTVGAVVSRVIEAWAESEILPSLSLYQT